MRGSKLSHCGSERVDSEWSWGLRDLGEKKGDWLAEKKAAEDDEDMFLEGFVGY